MQKLKDDRVDATHLQAYLASNSDFAFEMRALRTLRDLGLVCRHGGTYEDPVTSKTRQFDIYAELSQAVGSEYLQVLFAVECKNLRTNFPLLVHRIPRDPSECYIEIMFARDPPKQVVVPNPSRQLRISGDISPYAAGEPVGKSYDQVGRAVGGGVIANDQDVFEKMSQALNSSYQLLQDARNAAYPGWSFRYSLIIPVLVVPRDTLWSADYDNSGSLTSGPALQSAISVFIGKEWTVGGMVGHPFTLSHLEIITIDEIEPFVSAWRDGRRLTQEAILQATPR